MRVKICGVTSLEDALFAINNGAWAVGFNFYKHSPRYLSLEEGRKICAHLPRHIHKVGIFCDAPAEKVRESLSFLSLVQVYQQNSSQLVDKKRTIFPLQVSSEDKQPSKEDLGEYAYILLDAPRKKDSLLGGTGRLADWKIAKSLAKDYRLILAGGLDSTNLEEAIHEVKPFAVDVASGVESFPGVKNKRKTKDFLEKSKDVR